MLLNNQQQLYIQLYTQHLCMQERTYIWLIIHVQITKIYYIANQNIIIIINIELLQYNNNNYISEREVANTNYSNFIL